MATPPPENAALREDSRILGRSAWLMLGAVAAWASLELVAATLREYAPLQLVAFRYAFHLLFMFLCVAPRVGLSLVKTRMPVYQLLRGGVMLALPVCFVLAAGSLKAAELAAVFALVPVLVLIEARLGLGERVGRRLWSVALLACCGVQLIVGVGPGILRPALLFPIGMAVSISLYLVLTRATSRIDGTWTNLFYPPALVLVGLAPWLGEPWPVPSVMDGLKLVAVGVLGFTTLYLIEKALESSPVAPLAPWVYTQPLWILAARTVVVGAPPPALVTAGGVLVVGCLIYNAVASR